MTHRRSYARGSSFNAALLAAVAASVGSAHGNRVVVGAGASFPLQVYKRWMVSVDQQKESIRYTYKATGSGTGKSRLLSGAVDFAGSDSPLSTEQRQECPQCWFVPSLAGAVAVGYNVPGLSSVLRIPREVLASIFLGRVRMWSELAELNPQLVNTTERIRLVVRADKSGTTQVFTEALSSFSSEFAENPGVSSLPDWPSFELKAKGTDGLARSVLIQDFSIGYLSLVDAKQWKLPTAMISNAEGEFVEPTVETVQAAMDALPFDTSPDSTLMVFSLVDPKGVKNAYPIATLTYLAFDAARLTDCDRLYNVIFLIYWAMFSADALTIVADNHFVSLSRGLRDYVLSVLWQLTCAGVNLVSQLQSRAAVSGAGASFPFQVYDLWMLVIKLAGNAQNNERVKYSYEATGSGTGKSRLLSGAVDFAGSDSPLSTEQRQECPQCWFVPSLAGAVAVGYNVPGLSSVLRIPREVLASIFLGRVRMWSELAELNPQLVNTTERIRLVVRADKSGTTQVFTEALSSFSSEFAENPGVSSLPDWPSFELKAKGTDGLARSVLIQDFSIGYLSLVDAKQWKLPTAMISNAEGEFVEPTVETVQAAMDALPFDTSPDSTLMVFSLVDPKGVKNAYPIATLTYLAFDAARLTDCDRLYNVIFLIYWAMFSADALTIVADNHFVSLSRGLRDYVLSVVRRLTCDGEVLVASVERFFDRAAVPPIHLALLMPFSGWWDGGTRIAGAAGLAVERVNADKALLPGRRLEYSWADSGCSAQQGLMAMGELIGGPSKVDALIGPG